MGRLELVKDRRIEFEKVNVFEKQWFVSFISVVLADDGNVRGHEVSLFLPVKLGGENSYQYAGICKSVYVPGEATLSLGDVVALGFNRKQKAWYIKR